MVEVSPAVGREELKGRKPGMTSQRLDLFEAVNKSFLIMKILQVRIHQTGDNVGIISSAFLSLLQSQYQTNWAGLPKHTYNSKHTVIHQEDMHLCFSFHPVMSQAGVLDKNEVEYVKQRRIENETK